MVGFVGVRCPAWYAGVGGWRGLDGARWGVLLVENVLDIWYEDYIFTFVVFRFVVLILGKKESREREGGRHEGC